MPTDEEMRFAKKIVRPYISPYHEQEVQREKVMRIKRAQTEEERLSLPLGATQFRYPDGRVRGEPPPLHETAEFIEANTAEFPPGVKDLRGRSGKHRFPDSSIDGSGLAVTDSSYKGKILRDDSIP